VILPEPPLLVITDRTQASTGLVSIVTAVFNAGCRWVSVREKDLPAAEQVALTQALLAIAYDFGAVVTFHGNAALAKSSGADGVHLPEQGDIAAARAALGSAALIGISVHGIELLRVLDPTTVDYAIAGPVYLSASKPEYGPGLGPEGLQALISQTRIPVIGIAGIEPDNVANVIAAGAAGIAVMGGVMRATDPGTHTRALLRGLAAARSQLRAR
jgi:thiamine-phosphate pyrophosphorylase